MAGNMTFKSAATAGLCTAVLLGAACQKDSNPTAPASNPVSTLKKAPPTVKKGPTAEELTAGMVQAAPQGKSALALDMKFELASRPRVGQALDVNVALIPQMPGGPASLQITAATGFAAPDAAAFEIPDMEPGEVYRHTLKLTPSSEGLQVVNVTVSVKHEDISDTKMFSIPVIVDVK
jgi:hypothetical protein